MKRGTAAFTLVEILAALAFLGLVIPVAVSAIMIANRAAVVSERSMIAVQLGENRLNDLMLANAWTTAESRGTFDHPGYRWELKKQDWQTGAMSELTLEIFYQVQGAEQSVKLTTLVNEEVGLPE
jgi:type II secretory pathway pseudopilin PulG